jgi:hypothetical protein
MSLLRWLSLSLSLSLSLCAPLPGGPRRLHGHMCQPPVFSSLSLAATWGPAVSLTTFPQSPVRLLCSGHQPPMTISARAAPRSSDRVASGCPTPPRCRGHHLRAHGSHFCAIADRFCATPLPPPAGRYDGIPWSSSVRQAHPDNHPPLRPTPRVAASEPHEPHVRTGALATPSRCHVVASARESRPATLGHQRPDNAHTHASAPRHLCYTHHHRVASSTRHLTTSPSWTSARDKLRSSVSPSRWCRLLSASPALAPLQRARVCAQRRACCAPTCKHPLSPILPSHERL